MLTVALPSLIAPDLVITQPMTSITGYVPYMKYTAGITKGETSYGTVFGDPWTIGEPNGAAGRIDANYTGMNVVETAGYADVDASTHKVVTLAWTPVTSIAKVQKKASGADTWTDLVLDTNYTVGKKADGVTLDGTITLTSALSDGDLVKVAYVYDNAIVPQAALPTIKAEVANVQLFAKPRRIAVFYSQLTAFQSKQDYGVDLSANLVEQACGRLAYKQLLVA